TLSVVIFSSSRRHTIFSRDWSSDVCSSDLGQLQRALQIALFATGLERGQHRLAHVHVGVLATVTGEFPVRVGLVAVQAVLRFPRSEERRVGRERTCPSRTYRRHIKR